MKAHKYLKLVSIVLIGFLYFSCSGEGDRKERMVLPVSKGLDPALMASGPSYRITGTLAVKPPVLEPEAKEKLCDGKNDNPAENSLIDEGCCVCKPGAPKGDTNGDMAVTLSDGLCPLLISVGQTRVPYNPSCNDMDNNGVIDMNDMIQAVKLAR